MTFIEAWEDRYPGTLTVGADGPIPVTVFPDREASRIQRGPDDYNDLRGKFDFGPETRDAVKAALRGDGKATLNLGAETIAIHLIEARAFGAPAPLAFRSVGAPK
jgi:hypothetical protein